ncbi:TPA: hypothetical protein ACH3X2_009485 [Trebouxia sp. C0005]
MLRCFPRWTGQAASTDLHTVHALAFSLCFCARVTGSPSRPVMFPVFSARGDRRESGNASSIVSASAACTGREAVQLQVAPSLIPYISNFTGVNVTVLTAKDTYISNSDSQYSALFAIHAFNLTIHESSFTNLNLAEVQAPIALDAALLQYWTQNS